MNVLADWRLAFNDPGVGSWIIVALYMAATATAFCASRTPPPIERPSYSGTGSFWLCCAGCLLLLGINKQLDLHHLMTDLARRMARSQGWYAYRREVQLVVMLATAAAGAGLMTYLIGWRRDVVSQQPLAFIGVGMLVVFVVLRTVSFHHVDHWLGRTVGGVKYHRLLEIAGITAVLVSSGRTIVASRIARIKAAPLTAATSR